MLRITLLSTLIALSAGAAFAQEVKTDGGLLAGSMAGDVRVYKGIPYAAPPVGKLRWRPPQPAAAWQGVRDATKFSPACPQARSADNAPEASQSEDCLCLNVYTAAKTARERRPVMVWIHGGSLANGSGSLYDGAALARKGVIVVTINYRLNVFGFLAHPALSAESAHKSSGNVGLLDQIAALEWVRRNIAAFGGDANNVTIFGESAGSWSVNLLLATPLSKGLFHRAIGESGGEFEPNPHLSKSMPGQESAEAIGARVLARLGCGQAADPLACAREKKTEDVLAAIANGFRAQPCVDGWFLPAEVHAIFAARKQHPVPVIVGFNADEGAQFAARMTPATAEEYTLAIRRQFGAFADEYLKLYPAGSRDVMLDSAARRFRDERHTWKMLTWARMMEPMKSGVWLYYFTQVAPDSRFGAHHAAEIIYVFDNLHRRQAAWTEADKRVAHAMSSYWVNFAKTGDPNGAGLLHWPRYETKRDPYLEFGPEIKSKTGLHPAAFAFWDKYFTAQRAQRQEAQ
jgi:para-nitrobenzyl esterase